MSKTKEYICFPGLVKQKPWCNVFAVHVHAIPSSRQIWRYLSIRDKSNFFAGKWPKTFENSIGIPYDALFWSFVCKNMNLFFKRTISFPALKISILLMVLSYVAAEICWERGELVNEWCVQIFFQNENTMWRCETVFETKHFLISVSYSLNAIARPLYF